MRKHYPEEKFGSAEGGLSDEIREAALDALKEHKERERERAGFSVKHVSFKAKTLLPMILPLHPKTRSLPMCVHAYCKKTLCTWYR